MFAFIADCENCGVSSPVKARGDACRYSSWLNLNYPFFCFNFKCLES